MEGLHEAGVEDEIITAIQGDLSEALLTAKDRALLSLAEWLTTNPSMSAGMVRQAREAGWSDTEVAHAIFVISYFNMVTRIADAFALPPDEYHPFDPEAALPMLRCGD